MDYGMLGESIGEWVVPIIAALLGLKGGVALLKYIKNRRQKKNDSSTNS